MTPEDQLCLLLARGHLPPAARSRALELLAAPLRWDLLLARAGAHEVTPLVYRNLATLEFSGVPDPVRARLTDAFRINAIRSMLFAQELARLLRLLNQAGVPSIPLKGVTLAESLYGDYALRVSSDMDILVPPGEVVRARRLLLGHGYTSPFAERFFAERLVRTGDECCLVRKQQRLSYVLELHWKLLFTSSRNAEAVDSVWAEARPKTFFGVPARTLSPEWELLFLAVHAASHKWMTLKWLIDIDQVCVSGLVDWQKIRELTERLEVGSVVRASLGACASLFDTPLPSDFCRGTVPAWVSVFPASPSYFQSFKAYFVYLHLLERPLEKLRRLAAICFVPTLADHQFVQLPSSLSPLYYPLRLLRLTCKWSWLLFSAGLAQLARLLRFPRRRRAAAARAARVTPDVHS
jgi:hypothetical protein